MKKYRAVVIDGKKAIRRMTLGMTLIVVMLVGIFDINLARPDFSEVYRDLAQNAVAESVPQSAGANEFEAVFKGVAGLIKKGISFVLGFDPFDARTVMFGQVPLIHTVSRGALMAVANEEWAAVFNPQNADLGEGEAEPKVPEAERHRIYEVDSSQGKALGSAKNKILIRNETSFAINTEEFLNSPLRLNMKGDGPKVLIVHTHATECYSPEGASTYQADKSDRSADVSENMVAVGEAVKKVFDENGIWTIHDKTLHDQPSFNGSYANSLRTVEGYLAKYPSISVVLDLHRDAFIYEDGSKAKFATDIGGKKTAQLMLVVGTNGGGLDHPEWRENMKFALKLQSAISAKYPRLMRGVNLRKERFNGHTTFGSIIIEVGSSGNTLAEAIRGATLGAEEIAKFLKTL